MLRTRGSGTKEHPPVERSSGVARFAASMLKVGAIGFGGGSALIPILHAELVETGDVVPAGKLSEAEFTHDTVIANITPGALPVKMDAPVGRAGSPYRSVRGDAAWRCCNHGSPVAVFWSG